jgi:hypothetical protein
MWMLEVTGGNAALSLMVPQCRLAGSRSLELRQLHEQRQINDIKGQGSVVSRTSKTQPYPPKIAAPQKAAAKMSMLRVGHASMESTLSEAQEWNIKGHLPYIWPSYKIHPVVRGS